MRSIVLESKECAKALNELARHQAIVRLEQEILFDMHVCEVEGWDKMEFIEMLRDLINGLGEQGMKEQETYREALE